MRIQSIYRKTLLQDITFYLGKPFVLPIQSISAKKPLLLAIHLQYIVVSNFSWSADNVNVYQYQSCNGIEDRNILQMPCIFTKIDV